MLFGIDIDYLYIGVLSAVAFCLLMAGIVWIVNEVREWKRRKRVHTFYNNP